MKIDHIALFEYNVRYGLVHWDFKRSRDGHLIMGVYSSLQTWGNGTKNDVYLLGVF